MTRLQLTFDVVSNGQEAPTCQPGSRSQPIIAMMANVL